MVSEQKRLNSKQRRVDFGYPWHTSNGMGSQTKPGFSAANSMSWYDSSEILGVPREGHGQEML